MLTKAQQIIKNKPYLIWFTKDYSDLSNKAVLESVLNYGEWVDVVDCLRAIGFDESKELFEVMSAQKRCNLDNRVNLYFKNFFKLNESQHLKQ